MNAAVNILDGVQIQVIHVHGLFAQTYLYNKSNQSWVLQPKLTSMQALQKSTDECKLHDSI